MSPAGGNPERVTFTGSYNIHRLSAPMALAGLRPRVGGAFKLQVMELASASVTQLTDTGR
jgi:TolB protein